MRVASVVVGGSLLVGMCAAQAGLPLIAIDPNSYSTGQIITDSTGEGQFSALSAYLNPASNVPPQQQYLLQSSAVFASQAPLTCNSYLGGPCAPSGNKLFGWSPIGPAGPWGDAANAVKCLGGDCDTSAAGAFAYPVLEINFTRPTDYVDAQIGFVNDPDGGWIQAFNGAGQSLGYCGDATPGKAFAPGSCGSYPNPSDPAWAQYSVTDSSRDISYVLIGGESNFRSVGEVRYDLPEPGSLGLLTLGVAAVGFSTFLRRRRAAHSSI